MLQNNGPFKFFHCILDVLNYGDKAQQESRVFFNYVLIRSCFTRFFTLICFFNKFMNTLKERLSRIIAGTFSLIKNFFLADGNKSNEFFVSLLIHCASGTADMISAKP